MCRRMIALYVVRKGQFSHQIAGTKKEKDSEKKHTKNTQKSVYQMKTVYNYF